MEVKHSTSKNFVATWKWLFKHKYHVDGPLVKYKAWIVARGFFKSIGSNMVNFFLLVNITSLCIFYFLSCNLWSSYTSNRCQMKKYSCNKHAWICNIWIVRKPKCINYWKPYSSWNKILICSMNNSTFISCI
jgi:hypothetical protein